MFLSHLVTKLLQEICKNLRFGRGLCGSRTGCSPDLTIARHALACRVNSGLPPRLVLSLLRVEPWGLWSIRSAAYLPLHRQEKVFGASRVGISRQTMRGWRAECAALSRPFIRVNKTRLFQSKVIGTDDPSEEVLEARLPFARTGRIWPYYADQEYPVTV